MTNLSGAEKKIEKDVVIGRIGLPGTLAIPEVGARGDHLCAWQRQQPAESA